MTHFRFRYRPVGFICWRRRAARRRIVRLFLPLGSVSGRSPSQATWRPPPPPQVLLPAPPRVLSVGNYVVSEQGDPRLSGHPDIRY